VRPKVIILTIVLAIALAGLLERIASISSWRIKMHRKKRKHHVLMLLIAVTWLGLAGAATPVRSQDLICCDIIFIDADGPWFGARRDCKAALEDLSPASRTKACAQIRQWKPAEPAPWFKPFSASRSGCCLEAAEVCRDPSLACTEASPANRPKLPNKSPCKAGDANVTPTITIDLPETLNIDESPQMPEIKATAKVSPSSTDVSWTAQITYKLRRCSGPSLPILDSPKVTGQGETFTPDFGGIYGGKLEITATTTCGTGAKTTITRNVGGLNADPTEVRNEIGTMDAPFEADDLKKIACHESGQRQFTSRNTPTLGPGDDTGIMQICYERRLDDIWNWKTNIARGRANLLSSADFSRGIPRKVRRRMVRGKGPWENATDFTPEQLRLEAIKRYNAGNETDVGYWEWNDAAGIWDPKPQLGGDPAYVANVTGQNANCPR